MRLDLGDDPLHALHHGGEVEVGVGLCDAELGGAAVVGEQLAERISALLGTQPVFRQSPPILCFSISATFALTAAAM